MTSENGDTVAGGAVPYADGLVIGCGELRCGVDEWTWDEKLSSTHDPRHLVMKLYGTNVVQVTVQSEEAAAVLRTQVWGGIRTEYETINSTDPRL